MPDIHTLSFTPSIGGKVRLSASFTTRRVTGSSDFGSSEYSRLFLTQNAITTNSNQIGNSISETPQNLVFDFDVDAGLLVTCGLYGNGGIPGVFWSKINLVAQLIDES